MRRQLHRLLRVRFRYTFHLEQNLAGTDNSYPMIWCALALAHTGFGRLLGDRLVGEKSDPDFAATLDETRHRDTAGFNLAVGDVTRLQNFQPEVAKRQRRSTPCFAAHAPALLFAVLHFLWH